MEVASIVNGFQRSERSRRVAKQSGRRSHRLSAKASTSLKRASKSRSQGWQSTEHAEKSVQTTRNCVPALQASMGRESVEPTSTREPEQINVGKNQLSLAARAVVV